MIIFTGWGFLVPLILFLSLLAVQFALDAVYGAGGSKDHPWGLPVALLLGAVLVTAVGRYVNRKRWLVIDEDTEDALGYQERHSFVFIPIQYWGLLSLLLAAFLFMDL